MDFDELQAYAKGKIEPPCKELVFVYADYGDDYMKANAAARERCHSFSYPWRYRYTQPPIWVVSIPNGYALVPNRLYHPNLAWKDAVEISAAA
jgi:hypothetical protein